MNIKKHRAGSTRATILPKAIIALVSMMALGSIVARVLLLRRFFGLFFYHPTIIINISAIIMQHFSYTGKREVLQQGTLNPQYFPLLTSGAPYCLLANLRKTKEVITHDSAYYVVTMGKKYRLYYRYYER